jgi:hypothetical protein
VAHDPLLRRIETAAVVVCAATAAMAWVVSRDGWRTAIAVVAGGLLMGTSYWLIASSARALATSLVPGLVPGEGRRPSLVWIVVKLAGRYALLALLAYVMISRLRLPPLGLLAGVSSIVAAASIEAVRSLVKTDP